MPFGTLAVDLNDGKAGWATAGATVIDAAGLLTGAFAARGAGALRGASAAARAEATVSRGAALSSRAYYGGLKASSGQRAVALVRYVEEISGVRGARLIDKVEAVAGRSEFVVTKSGKRIIRVSEDVFRSVDPKMALREVAHEVVHAEQFGKMLVRYEGNFDAARKAFYAPESSLRYAIDEVVAKTVGRRRIERYFNGALRGETAEWSNSYIRLWRSLVRARR